MEEENNKNFEKKIKEKIKLLGLKSKRFEYPDIGSNAEEEIEKAKKKHRSDFKLKHWKKLKYYKNTWCEEMLKNPPKGQQEVSYENYDELNIEEFREKYEKLNKPLIIKGCTDKWDATENWNFDVNIFGIFYVKFFS